MRTPLATLALASVGLLVALPSVESKERPCRPWVPHGDLKDIPFHYDCSKTKGDIGVARTDGIYWCTAAEAKVEQRFPGASHFYFVHEYGHYVKGTDEIATDCWAAEQLAGTCTIDAVYVHLMAYADDACGTHGTCRDRARRLRACAEAAEAAQSKGAAKGKAKK